jgi:hypothetical protein
MPRPGATLMPIQSTRNCAALFIFQTDAAIELIQTGAAMCQDESRLVSRGRHGILTFAPAVRFRGDALEKGWFAATLEPNRAGKTCQGRQAQPQKVGRVAGGESSAEGDDDRGHVVWPATSNA